MIEKDVSVVIPVFNRPEKIIRALESVKNQSAINCIKEIIIIDDGSTDNTAQSIVEYSKNNDLPIKLKRQKNGGVSVARNAAIDISSGYYIAFLDSDDEWLPHKIEMQLKLFEKNPDIDFLGGGKPLTIGFRKTEKLYRAKLNDLLIKSFPVTPSVIFKRNIVSKVGKFDEKITHYEDCDYWQRICAFGFGCYYYAEEVVIVDNKKPFGEVGLSSDLAKIKKDCQYSLKKRLKENTISYGRYCLFSALYLYKHIRRVAIVKARGKQKNYENTSY